MEYHFDLVGLHTLLRTEETISVSHSIRPFLCSPGEPIDCTITVRRTQSLPDKSPVGVWYGPEYYTSFGDIPAIFHCTACQADAFAVTRFVGENTVEISVLPDSLCCFSGTTGILNRIGLETLLLQHHGLLLHASFIKYAGQGIAFTGPSGVGKSTQAAIWETALNAEIINGDRAALRKIHGLWEGFGSPLAGTSGIYRRDRAPLKAIVVLRQGEKNCLYPLSRTQAFACIWPELSVHRWDSEFSRRAMDLCLELLEDVPVYLLECVPDESAALLLKKGLNL